MSFMFFLGGYMTGAIFGFFISALMFITKREENRRNNDQTEL